MKLFYVNCYTGASLGRDPNSGLPLVSARCCYACGQLTNTFPSQGGLISNNSNPTNLPGLAVCYVLYYLIYLCNLIYLFKIMFLYVLTLGGICNIKQHLCILLFCAEIIHTFSKMTYVFFNHS